MGDRKRSDTLKMVFTVFRHGDRVPIRFTPNDKNKNHWANELGSLTNNGKLQAFELGKVYRQRYDGFLSANYVPSEVYVYSTDSDRCLMSAQCCLAAMYPPTKQDKWLPTLDWQPIPVHTKPTADDPKAANMDAFTDLKVDSSGTEYTKERHKKWYQNYIENADIWEKWRKFTFGNDPLNLGRLAATVDTIIIEMKNGLPYELPPDTELKSSYKMIFESMALAMDHHPYFIRQGSDLLTDILKSILGHVSDSQKTKMYMYSMHDLNLLSVMGQLDITLKRTEYCGNLTFELHKLEDGQYYVRLQHCLRHNSEPVDIPLVDKDIFCPLKLFEDLVGVVQGRADRLKN